MRVGYYRKEHGETTADATYFGDSSSADWRGIAEEAAQYAWVHNDGWEWLRTGIVLTLVANGKDIGDFEITVDYDPEFTAHRVKEVKP